MIVYLCSLNSRGILLFKFRCTNQKVVQITVCNYHSDQLWLVMWTDCENYFDVGWHKRWWICSTFHGNLWNLQWTFHWADDAVTLYFQVIIWITVCSQIAFNCKLKSIYIKFLLLALTIKVRQKSFSHQSSVLLFIVNVVTSLW